MEPNNDEVFECEIDDECIDLKVGMIFSSEEETVQGIEKWSYRALCPLAKTRSRQAKEGVKGRRCFGCPHGILRTSKVLDFKYMCLRARRSPCN